MAVNKLLILLFFIFSFILSGAQTSVLEQKTSIDFNNQSLEKCIYQLGKEFDVSFSYNPDHFEVDKEVNSKVENSRLIDILHTIINKEIEVKQIGNTIILKNSNYTSVSKKTKYDISGVIIDAETGKKISQASIYQVDGVRSAFSSKDGNYKIKVVSTSEFVELSYNHTQYKDTIIIIKPSEIGNLKVELSPKFIDPIAPRRVSDLPTSTRNIDTSTIVKILIPKRKRRFIENIPFLGEPQPVQLSLIPSIGTNLDMNAAMENKASINLLAGYSRAVDGFEAGGLLNIVREDVKGTQLCGFGNVVGGNVDGFQAAGFFNNVKGKVDGVQLSGFSNVVLDTVDGVQAAGFMNITNKKVSGVQLAGYLNAARESVDGAQLSGFSNICLDTVTKGQISGFGNIAKRAEGAQISGFINIAKSVKGIQLAPFNIADTIEKGASIGLFSFVRKGYHPLEFSITDLNTYSLRLKTGTRAFYNIIEAGISIGDFTHWHYNYGIGHSFVLRDKRAFADLEFSTGVINPNTGFNNEFNLINKLELMFSYRIIGPVHLFFGPAINSIISENEFVRPFDLPFNNGNTNSTSDIKFENYFGYRFGLRI